MKKRYERPAVIASYTARDLKDGGGAGRRELV